ncbi:endothelial cell-specific chemotaxis regulator-like isoform X1 [Sinocyclocheilus anshuiensis]|uniref:endothelial cell-specific chemotaxis regulator-like isoform X1 n=1 Tax=Sinocyclocheilus anshuiensis TaxID=1608454 RepID=UPI0007B95641|nr:PREDICTED: endothelial cell-specific chemotaxis regulator-like isoform X1 [Sinocyclocheilus anshuiensis]
MEQLFFLLIPLFASSSIISAGNDTSIQTTLPPNTNATSPWSVDSRTEVQTEKTMTSAFSSQYENGKTSHTSKTVSITTAPVSSSHTGQSINTSSKLTTPKSYTDTTLNSTSSPAAKITVGVSVLANTANSNISLSEGTPTPSQAPDSGLTLLAFGVMSLILILIVVMVVLVTAINLRGQCRDTRQHEGIKSCDSVVSDSNMTSNCEKESITLVSVRTINTENNTDSPQMSSVHSTILDNEDQEFTRDLLGINDGL